MSSTNKYEPLRVWLDEQTTDIYTNYYNKSYILWEYIKMEVNEEDREFLGLYGPDYHAINENDGQYVQTYTIGDLINFLNYNYYYPSIYVPNMYDDTTKNVKSGKVNIHRRLTIIPIPADRIDRKIMHEELDSDVMNARDEYIWRISVGDDVIGEDTELINALYDAVNAVYLTRKLYKCVTKRDSNSNRIDREVAVDPNKRYIIRGREDYNDIFFDTELSESIKNQMGLYGYRYRASVLSNGKKGDNFKYYDAGDLISFLFYNYYYDVILTPTDNNENKTPKTIKVNRRLSIVPYPVRTNVDENNTINIPEQLNDRTKYEWLIKLDAEIIGKGVYLVDALWNAIDVVYRNKLDGQQAYPEPLYKTILEEIKQTQPEYEEQKEFSLSNV
jgi:hypothetical protein